MRTTQDRRQTCSVGSTSVDEQLVGSAPQASAWLALEQSGPWGARAFTDSHLDPGLGRTIENAATVAGVRPCLIRRPGRHADAGGSGSRTLLLAHTGPRHTWMLRGEITDPGTVLELDLAALAAGDEDAVLRSLPDLRPHPEPQLLVCTNGSRDLCCALEGRPLVTTTAAARPGQVWEVTHTSGHRFAPTTVLLPYGILHGRVPLHGGAELLDAAAAGTTVLGGYRGRTTWTGPGQVAELAVRERALHAPILALDALDVRRAGEAWRVTHHDGRAWLVQVRSEETGVDRAESCGKDAVPMRRYVVDSLVATATGEATLPS
jgi:hypothetical protein